MLDTYFLKFLGIYFLKFLGILSTPSNGIKVL